MLGCDDAGFADIQATALNAALHAVRRPGRWRFGGVAPFTGLSRRSSLWPCAVAIEKLAPLQSGTSPKATAACVGTLAALYATALGAPLRGKLRPHAPKTRAARAYLDEEAI